MRPGGGGAIEEGADLGDGERGEPVVAAEAGDEERPHVGVVAGAGGPDPVQGHDCRVSEARYIDVRGYPWSSDINPDSNRSGQPRTTAHNEAVPTLPEAVTQADRKDTVGP